MKEERNKWILQALVPNANIQMLFRNPQEGQEQQVALLPDISAGRGILKTAGA